MARSRVACAFGIGGFVGSLTVACGMANAQATPPARLLADTVLGSGSGWGASFAGTTQGAPRPPAFVHAQNTLFFRAGTSSETNDLFKTDGRPGGTTRVFRNVQSSIVPLSDQPSSPIVFLAAPSGQPIGLYALSPAHPTGVLLAQGAVVPRSMYVWSDRNIPTLNGNALFVAPKSTGPQIWTTDGTPQGTRAITNMVGAQVRDLAVTRTHAYFLVIESGRHRIYATDGSAAGVRQIWSDSAAPTWGGGVAPLATSDDAVFFLPFGPQRTVLSHDPGRGLNTNVSLPPGTVSNPIIWLTRDGTGVYLEQFLTFNGVSRSQLWRFTSDESQSGLLLDLHSSVRFHQIAASNGITIFADSARSYTDTPNLWFTDGTPHGTFALSRVMSSVAADQSGLSRQLNGGTFWFSASTDASGIEPAAIDLASGLMTRLDAAPGVASSFPSAFAAASFGDLTAFVTRINNQSQLMGSKKFQTPRLLTSTPVQSSSPVGSIGHRVIFWSSATSGLGIEPHVIDLCPADYDNNNAVNVVDLLDYINDFMAGSPKADMDGPGTAPQSADLVVFLNAWFQGY